MRRTLMYATITAACALSVIACTPGAGQKIDTALASPAGQLFCQIQIAGGGTVVAGMVNATASIAVADTAANSAGAPAAAAFVPLTIIATGATKAFVDQACAKANGVPVSPPADPVAAPKVAVVPPAV